MIHPHVELRHVGAVGYGTVATTLIPRGTITWVRDALDQALSPEQVATLPPPLRQVMNKYSYADSRGARVLCWDHGRFVNHSCEATCLSPGFDFEVAVRDILPGQELTDDYATLGLDEPFECLCGAPSCRRIVRPDDPDRETGRWDDAVADAFPLIAAVDQPLWSLVREKSQVEAVLAQRIRPPSGRIHQPRRVA